MIGKRGTLSCPDDEICSAVEVVQHRGLMWPPEMFSKISISLLRSLCHTPFIICWKGAKRLFISLAKGRLAISALYLQMKDVNILQAYCSVSSSLESFLIVN